MSLADLPLEIIGEIAGKSRLVYHPLILAYPRFARSLTLGDRLDFAEKFGYDCRVRRFRLNPKIVWSLNGKRHRIGEPAVEFASGQKEWYVRGKCHRVDGPAIEYANGDKHWYFGGKLHRPDGPAIEWADGQKEWYFGGKLHRVDGPAIEYSNGSKKWYRDGKQHRIDGYATELSNGFSVWYVNDKHCGNRQIYSVSVAMYNICESIYYGT